MSTKQKQDQLKIEYQNLISAHWDWIDNDYPIVERTLHHRKDVDDLSNMGEIKYNVFKYLGYIPVFFFIVQYYCRRDHCGPFRNIEKAFALIYQLIFGLSGAKMNDL